MVWPPPVAHNETAPPIFIGFTALFGVPSAFTAVSSQRPNARQRRGSGRPAVNRIALATPRGRGDDSTRRDLADTLAVSNKQVSRAVDSHGERSAQLRGCAVAGPPSPAKANSPVPATVVM